LNREMARHRMGRPYQRAFGLCDVNPAVRPMSEGIYGDGGNLGAVRARAPAVYLCGPITGTSAAQAMTWRQDVAAALDVVAEVIDPTRDAVDYVQRSADAAAQRLTADRLRHAKGIVTRDRFDIRRSDLVLACFLGARAVSIGSVGEIFWADAMGKPVVIVREDDNPHNHDMLNEIAGWIFADLGSAVEQVKRLLRPNRGA
jgi:nucleoside 2-deoxyribosyltransferase